MTKKKTVIVYIYNSFKDPLFRGTVLVYLKEIALNHHFNFHLITYEQSAYRLTYEEKKIVKHELKEYNIYWHPLKYHSGGIFMLIKKLYDFLIGFALVLKIKIKYRTPLIISLGNIAGGFSFLYAKILWFDNFILSYEPHSEFMVDFGIWKKKSLKYKLLNKIEYIMGIYSTYIATGTSYMVERMKKWNCRAQIYRLPSCVDSKKFFFNIESKEKIRKQLDITDQKIFLYVGKFGGIYYKEEIALACKVFYKADPKSFFLIVTPNDNKEITEIFNKYEIPQSNFFITSAHYDHIQDYISASDIGIVAIPPLPSQKYRSPIKVGEYLLCGLPYIVVKGVSEDDVYAEKYNIGVVIDTFSEEAIKKTIPQINKIFEEDSKTLKERCRAIGKEYRDSNLAYLTFLDVLNKTFKTKN